MRLDNKHGLNATERNNKNHLICRNVSSVKELDSWVTNLQSFIPFYTFYMISNDNPNCYQLKWLHVWS